LAAALAALALSFLTVALLLLLLWVLLKRAWPVSPEVKQSRVKEPIRAALVGRLLEVLQSLRRVPCYARGGVTFCCCKGSVGRGMQQQPNSRKQAWIE
jgi:hypothetical protein